MKREKSGGDNDLTRLPSVPFEMDLPHQLHDHAAKRLRLDEVPGSWAKPTEEQIEEPHLQLSWSPFYQASSDPRLTLSAIPQDFLAPDSCGLPARPYPNTVSSGFEAISTQSYFNGQSSSQASRFYETHALPGGDTYETQPTGTWYQSGPCTPSHRPVHGQTSLNHLQLHGFIMLSVHSLSRLTHSDPFRYPAIHIP
jgi:hypothetical protein